MMMMMLINCRWDNHAEIGFCSKDVEIMFYAVYNTYKQIGEKAALVQNRSIMDQMVEDVRSSVYNSSFFYILPPFHNVSHSIISHIHINVNKFR